MALINNNNEYIKLFSDGSFMTYDSKEERDKQKKATSSETIIKKYEEILSQKENELVSFGKKKNLLNLDPDSEEVKNLALNQGGVFSTYFSLNRELNKWGEEFINYKYNLQNNNANGIYPLMSNIFPDINNSIVPIKFSGEICVDTESVSEFYDLAKKEGYFGKTVDA